MAPQQRHSPLPSPLGFPPQPPIGGQQPPPPLGYQQQSHQYHQQHHPQAGGQQSWGDPYAAQHPQQQQQQFAYLGQPPPPQALGGGGNQQQPSYHQYASLPPQPASAPPTTPVWQPFPYGYPPTFPSGPQPLYNYNQPLFNAPPSQGYAPLGWAAGPYSGPNTLQFPPGVQQPPFPHSYQPGSGASFSSPLGHQQPPSAPQFPHEGTDDYYDGDDEEDWDQDYYMDDEQDGGFTNNEAQASAVPLGGPPQDLANDPIYQQTIQQVSALRAQFNTSPKNGATPVPTLRPTFPKLKRGLEDDAGDLDLDHRRLEEAVHEAKRRRVGPDPENFFNNVQKVFTAAAHPAPQSFLPEPMEEDEPAFNGLDLDLQILGLGPEFEGAHYGATLSLAGPRRSYGVPPPPAPPKARDPSFRILESACSSFWLMIEVTKHLRVRDLVNLYSVSRTFHGLVNSRFQSTVAAWAQHMSPAGWKVFYWKFYGKHTVQDPAGRTWAAPGPVAFPRPAWDVKPRLASNTAVRRVPSLRYLAMLEQRETRTRDILACLARAGHRLPKTAHVTLKKIWLLMDCATNAQRRGFIHNPALWTEHDLYTAQMFFVKLHMRFNEPLFGPDSPLLADTFLGARDGLTPLWRLLRRKAYTDPVEVIQQRLRYWCPDEDVDHWRLVGGSGKANWNVPPGELGENHREGWGTGHLHLLRPDELIVEECVRRQVDMQQHLVFMVFWGHVDLRTRRNLVPTEEEMYMSDDDDERPLPACGPFSRTGTFGKCGNVPFDYDDWQPKHAMKARWRTLTRAEKLWVVKHDSREQEGTLVYEDGDGFWDDFNVNDYPDPEEEDRLAALRLRKPNLNDLERKVLGRYHEKRAQGGEIDYADIVSLSGSSDSFFAEPNMDEPDYRALEEVEQVEEEAARNRREEEEEEEEERAREQAQPVGEEDDVYEDDEIPPIPANVTDPLTIANWNDMDPYLHRVVIEEHRRLEMQARKDKRTRLYLERQEEKKKKNTTTATITAGQEGGVVVDDQSSSAPASPGSMSSSALVAPPPPRKYHYDYPHVTDPHLLSLLRRYDQFPPEAFGDQFASQQPHPGRKNDGDGEEEEEYDDQDDWEQADDQGLRALAEVDYDSDELDFDVDVYQKFLDRVGDDGGARRRAVSGEETTTATTTTADGSGGGGGSKLHKRRGKNRKEDEDDDDTMMAHEADVLGADDDIPFPEYEFRHF